MSAEEDAARGGAAGAQPALSGGEDGALRALELPGVSGEWAAEAPPPAGLLDPANALRTLHWGRNYLWVAAWPGGGEVVVKQFRHDSLRARMRRKWSGSKARKSFVIARAMTAASIATPEPLLWAESAEPSGPAWYVCRLAEGIEARYPFRALAAGTLERDFPDLTAAELIGAAATTARRLHEARFWHRDLSAGNLLLQRRTRALVAAVVDLNRCRRLASVTFSQRLRDLARVPVHREEDQRALLTAYFAAAEGAAGSAPRDAAAASPALLSAAVPTGAWRLYRTYHRSFHGRHRLKNKLRGRDTQATSGRAAGRGLLSAFRPRRAYPHLPPPPAGAATRDRIVWDSLSDQPHQHASRAEKLLVRARDLGPHLRAQMIAAAAAPRIWRRYRELMAGLGKQPVSPGKLGIGLRPYPEDPDALLAAVDELGVRHALVRLHPWQETHDDEEALARALRERGIEILFALPQRRELVRDLPRWRRAVDALGARFAPYAEAFQVGQAINRSKWGVWTLAEYRALLREAAAALAPHGVPIVGPGVIDFEPHVTAAAVNWPDLGVRFHALASLLYVDRRGAPENKQLGFDTLRKVALLRAVADTAKWCEPRSWITEVNWPLREGPHSPAGRDVAVDEQTAADYAIRYCTSLLSSGLVERVYWWQLIARGYGLLVAEDGGLRRRPAFHALATERRLLGGTPHRVACSDL